MGLSMSTVCVFISSAVVGLLVCYHFYLKESRTAHDRKCKNAQQPSSMSGITWITGGGFAVFAAICDAFIPSISLGECSSENITDVLASIHPELINHPTVLSDQEILKFKAFLCAGALEYGTHKHCLLALDRTTTKSEKMLLSTVLFLLSTSFGSLLITGYPLAFQVCHYGNYNA
jgi:hypothetical protein